MGREVLPQLGGQLVEVGEHAVEVAVLVDELGRSLLADARNTRQVVGGIAAQSGVLGILGRRHPGALLDAGLVVEGVVADPAPVVEHLHQRILDELVGVAVAGDDDDLVALVPRTRGQGGDHVVGLVAGHVDDRDAQGLDDLADQAHLLAQDVGRLGSARLVVGEDLVPERRLGPVEGGGNGVGPVVLQQVDEHRREPEHGVGDLSRRGRHVGGQREEGTIRERVPVDEQQPHGRMLGQPNEYPAYVSEPKASEQEDRAPRAAGRPPKAATR